MNVDPVLLAIALRQLERTLIVLGAIVSVVLGYRLFILLPMLDQQSSGRFQMPGGVSIIVSRIGPGVFFALFGAAVMAWSLKASIEATAVSSSEVAGAVAAAAASQPAGGASQVTTTISRHYSGITGNNAKEVADARLADRNQVVGLVRGLHVIESALAGRLEGKAKLDSEFVLENVRYRLMQAAWDEGAWGSLGEFQAWKNSGMKMPAPAKIATAAAVYKGVQQ